MTVLRAWLYLLGCGWRNRVRRTLRQARSPRYAIAMLVGIAYFVFVFRPWRHRQAPLGTLLTADYALLFASVGLALLVGWWWLFSDEKDALVFSQAEVGFLFPGPLGRRQLVQYKLLGAQAALVINTLIWVFLLGRGDTHIPLGLRIVTLWLFFVTIYLHRLGAALVRTSAVEHGRSGVRRTAIPLVIVLAVFAALVWGIGRQLPALRAAAAGSGSVVDTLARALLAPVPHAALLPFRLVLAPAFAPHTHGWLVAMLPALGIAALEYLWVVRTDAAFEEAAIEASARRAQRIEALRNRRTGVTVLKSRKGGVARPWFPLAPVGWPPVAIVWKNVIAVTRQLRAFTIILAVVGVGAVYIMASSAAGPAHATIVIRVIAAYLAGMLVFFGPMWIRNDLRQDLLRLDLLHTYPLDGTQLVAAEVASSTLVLTALQYGLFVVGLASAIVLHVRLAQLATSALILAAGLLLLPGINALALTIQNAGALLFPAWVHLGTTRARGVEAMGQSMLTLMASLILLVIALIVPAIVGGAVFYVGRHWLALGAVIPAALATSATALILVGLAVVWLGGVYERTEPLETGGV